MREALEMIMKHWKMILIIIGLFAIWEGGYEVLSTGHVHKDSCSYPCYKNNLADTWLLVFGLVFIIVAIKGLA